MSAVEQAGEVPGFADRLGDRLVVPQPSGALLEFLRFQSQLSSAPFFESAVKTRLKRLSNFRHGAYSRATRLQRDPAHGNRLTLVSVYSPGRRLSDVLALAKRGKVQPRIPAVLSLTRQLMTGVALLHDYAPDVFHGAVSTDRLVVTPEGHLVITEYVLGSAVEQGVSEWGTVRLWRDFRIPALSDTTLSRFGRRLDLVQIGLVALSLLLGRPLIDEEYPARLADLLVVAEEYHGDGEKAPLGTALREWLAKLLCLDPATSFRTLIEAQKAFVRLVEDEPRYGVSSHALESFFQQCEEAALLPLVPPSGAVPVAGTGMREPQLPSPPEPAVDPRPVGFVDAPAPETKAVDAAVAQEPAPPGPDAPVSGAAAGVRPGVAVEPAPTVTAVETPAHVEPVPVEPIAPVELAAPVEPAEPKTVVAPVVPVGPATSGDTAAASDALAVTQDVVISSPPPPAAAGRSLEEAARAAAEDAEPAALPVSPAEPPASQPDGVPGVADPFGPWPVVIGSDTVATLFDTFKAPDATRQSPVVEIPAPVVPAVAAELPPEHAANAWDLGLGTAPQETREWVESTEATAARQLRETLFEAPPASVPDAPVLSDPGPVSVPAWEPSFAPQPGRPAVEVVVVEPPAGLTVQAPPLPIVEPSRPEPRSPEPHLIEPPRPLEPVRADELQSGERRLAPAVLSYEEVHSTVVPRRSRVPLIAAAAAVLVLAVVAAVAGPRMLSLVRSATQAKKEPVAQSAGADAPGGFRITSQPPGAKIAIDGVARGTAPLKVEDLAPGLHSISVQSEWGTVEEAVNVESGKVAPLALATVGWIRVEAPVELEVSEEGKSFGRTGGGQLMVPAGRHHFVFVNQSVAARLRQFVDVPPGQVVKVAIDLPPGMLNLTSEQPAQVLLDGELLGDTPLVSVQAKLGPHEVIFRSARYGDVSYSINVTLAAPVRLNCSFAKR